MDENESIKALENLLLKSEELDSIQRQLERVNILEVFNITDSELAHSAFWAWLFDPKGTHRMGDRFLHAFLRQCVKDLKDKDYHPGWKQLELMDVASANFSDAKVSAEGSPPWMTAQGDKGEKIAKKRFDVKIDLPLLICEDEKKEAIVVIEFKIKAHEGGRKASEGGDGLQTEHYAQAIKTAIEEELYTHALAVYVDYKSGTAESPDFLSMSLQRLIETVLKPIMDSSSDIMPESVSYLIKQYQWAIGTEECDDNEERIKSLCENHQDALSILSNYIEWEPDLREIFEYELKKGTVTISFHDTKKSPVVQGGLNLRDGQIQIMVNKTGKDLGPFNTPSAAAQAAGRENRSYNGWTHWHFEGESLMDMRTKFKRKDQGRTDQYCEAILAGRRQAVEKLIQIAEEEGLLVKKSAYEKHGKSAPTLLTEMVKLKLLKPGQILYFKKDEEKTCTVNMLGDQVFLQISGQNFKSPSGASKVLYGEQRESNGFNDLYFKDDTGKFHPLKEIREKYNEQVEKENPNVGDK